MTLKFRLLPVDHGVRRRRITHAELSAAGIRATFESVLDPATWKGAIDIQVGDEIECVGLGFVRHIRVLSVGPEGATVEHIAGEPSAPKACHVFLCRERADAPHLFAFYQCESGAWLRLSPGQTSLAPLVEELGALIAREASADVTIVPWDLAKVQAVFAAGDAALAEAEILLPEGTPDPDRWVWAARDSRGESVARRFHRRTLAEQLREWLWYLSNCPYGAHEPDWRKLETSWHPGGNVLLIRSGWSARTLWPACFPEPPKFSEEYERLAAEQREKTLARRKGNLARKRTEENARVSAEIDGRQREALQAITDKFN
jgi:hypothetical protein